MTRQLTAIIQAEDDGFVALCPELDICSQGETVEEARANLREALELFFECASPDEVARRLSNEVYVTQLRCLTPTRRATRRRPPTRLAASRRAGPRP